jgi:hypothetical protein
MRRGIDSALVVGLAVALIGGAILFTQLHDVAVSNRALICSFGQALGSSKIEIRDEETLREFRKRVHLTRKFSRELAALAECEPPLPGVEIPSKARKQLDEARKRALRNHRERKEQGGDAQQTPPPASQQSGPPPSGPPPNPPNPGPNPPNPNPPRPPNPPRDPVDEVLDQTCDLVSGAGVPVC